MSSSTVSDGGVPDGGVSDGGVPDSGASDGGPSLRLPSRAVSTSVRAPCTSIPAGRTYSPTGAVRQRAYRATRPNAATARSGVG